MNQPVKLVLLIRSLNYGGAERQLVTLAQHLDRNKFSVTVVTLYEGGPLAEELHAAGVPVVSPGKRGRWDLLGFGWRLAKLMRALRPEVTHGYLDIPNLLVWALQPVTGAHVVWGVRASNLDWGERDWLEYRTFRLACRLARRAGLIICNSHAGRDFHLAHGYPPDTTIVIPNGIDTARFVIDREAGRRTRAAWGVADEEKLFGVVARFDQMKGHATLLRAATHWAGPTRLVLAGDGPAAYRDALQRQAQELGIAHRIIWAGAVREPAAVYNALNVLVLPSHYGEGWPNVVAEAMACGVPCVVTEVGDAARIVGDLGRVVPPRDVAALAGAVPELCAHAPAPAALRARVTDNFSVRTLAQRTEFALQELTRHTR